MTGSLDTVLETLRAHESELQQLGVSHVAVSMPSMRSKNPAPRLRDINDEIISEASRRLPPDLKDRRPEIDWVAVAAAGNIYRHEYGGVDEKLIWRPAQNDLEILRLVAESELDSLRDSG